MYKVVAIINRRQDTLAVTNSLNIANNMKYQYQKMYGKEYMIVIQERN